MTTQEEKYKIPLFDGSNFNNWKFRMETLLDELELSEHIRRPYTEIIEAATSDTAEQQAERERKLAELRKKDLKCKSQIVQRISDSHLEYVKDRVTAFEI